jgi:hypothetical protein
MFSNQVEVGLRGKDGRASDTGQYDRRITLISAGRNRTVVKGL